jgi:hypothetical protein
MRKTWASMMRAGHDQPGVPRGALTMSSAAVSHAEDQRVASTEISAHLEQLASIQVVDRRQLTEVWLEIRRCDSAALDALDGDLRDRYLPIVQHRRRPYPTDDLSSPRALAIATARMRVAIHRRVMVLHLARGRHTGRADAGARHDLTHPVGA